jgi:LacI family transcriptional regulator
MPRRRSKGEVTLREVAAQAGVSVMTVSNVINGRFSQMSAKTRVRVEHAIGTLNYRPHLMARNLRRSERLSIGVVFIDDDDPIFAAHPGHAYVIAGLSSFLNERGYSLTLQGVDRKQIESALPVRAIGTDALCVIQSGQKAQRSRILRRLSELGQPCAVIHETTLPDGLDACCVREDDAEGGRLISRHLIGRGCRRILLVLPTIIWASMEERERGITTECRKSDVQAEVIRCASARVEDVYEALNAYLQTNDVPDAIAAGNDQIAIAALKFLKQRGIPVPGRVRVTGFNAFEFWKYSDPLLTTIKAPAIAMGTRAGEELVRRLTVGSFSSRHIVLPVELVEGRST